MNYKVTLYATATFDYYVEADNEEEAKKFAAQIWTDGEDREITDLWLDDLCTVKDCEEEGG